MQYTNFLHCYIILTIKLHKTNEITTEKKNVKIHVHVQLNIYIYDQCNH